MNLDGYLSGEDDQTCEIVIFGTAVAISNCCFLLFIFPRVDVRTDGNIRIKYCICTAEYSNRKYGRQGQG
jgi:hypothetical protein